MTVQTRTITSPLDLGMVAAHLLDVFPTLDKRLILSAAEFGSLAADRMAGAVAASVADSTDMKGGVNAFVTHGPRDFVGKYAFQGK